MSGKLMSKTGSLIISGLLMDWLYIKPPYQTASGLIQFGFFFPPVETGIKIGRFENSPPAGMLDR